jgi:redox-sensitive bicupin YhaK (pirin superfamily)
MQKLFKAGDRGVERLDWLDTRFSFSFAGWHDPSRMGFRTLRVLNEDRIAPGAGFGRHAHRDMEILTVVLEGALVHEDSSGARAILRAGDVQRMSAGRGVAHSEWNASNVEALHLLQIWILPRERGTGVSHAEASGLFPMDEDTFEGLRRLVAPGGKGGALDIGQDAVVYAGRVAAGAPLEHRIEIGRGVFVHAVHGRLLVNGTALEAGDGLALEDEPGLVFTADPAARFLLFDLA